MVATRVGVGGLGPGGVGISGSSVCHIQTPLPGPICLHIHECRFAPVVAAGTYPRHKETYSMPKPKSSMGYSGSHIGTTELLHKNLIRVRLQITLICNVGCCHDRNHLVQQTSCLFT